ncbi:MAG TPA: acetylglutamate kinase [Petrimonas sp.]|uniref:acetylglutamate kinase n=1 Tax=Petrimonas sp. TaxID=2023866 RepID=UPI000966E8A4|nr:acetylglutamate kinase [Petrimonas sp.]MEA5045292.1 acetylglutamate kinase [Petrimonas sp.]MEA5063760.1 acetylglutamate kinase [Petrimonas sp.]OJV33600.1 MAG: acetylglutamate kinase [Bacteroidia bacterium 43-41]HHV84810.1 acetylglutamate kinase [Petrimonas sp.]
MSINLNTLSIVKIGGNIVDNPEALNSLLSDFHQLKGRKLLVHGGGVMASKMAERLGIETKMLDGRRITDAETLQLVTMVYAGWINKSIVASLQKTGCNAIGLSGADANCIPSERRSPVPIDFGFAGDPVTRKINGKFLSTLIENDVVPVFCAITHDENGSLLNTNADTIASSLAVALSEYYRTTLYYCFEKEGVLRDADDKSSLIPLMNQEAFAKLKLQGVVANGMIPKLDNSFKAINQGVSEVVILHAKNLLKKTGTRLIIG